MVFLSYSRTDLDLALGLEKLLLGMRFDVWRDEQEFDPGALWPKQLGEEISKASHFLLIWTQNAAQSRIVELEWNIALAIGIPVIPILQDDTAIPSVLRPIQGLPMNLRKDSQAVRRSLQQLEAKLREESDSSEKKSRVVIPFLEEISSQIQKSKGEIQVDQVLQAISDSPEIHIHVGTGPRNVRWWMLPSFAILVAGFLLTWQIIISDKSPIEIGYSLEGVLLDSASRQPLVGYMLTIPGDTDLTTSGGGFTLFTPELKVGEEVRLQVFYEGQFIHDQFIVHPGPETIFLNPTSQTK